MKIGILSDSHDNYVKVQRVIDIFNDSKVEMVLHGGDFVSAMAAGMFSQLAGAGFIGVFGNCDHEKESMQSEVNAFGGQMYDGIYTGRLDGVRVFMTHRCNVVDEVAGNGLYELVIYGHTHKRDIRKVGGSLIINPGETSDGLRGDSSIVMVDTKSMEYEVVGL